MKTKGTEKTALIIQGGALRSVFTAGVLDAFLVSGYNPFDIYISVSSGAMCLAYYLSGQYKMVHRMMIELSKDSNFMSASQVFSEQGYMNLEYLEEYSQKNYPLDIDAALKTTDNKECYMVATNLESGEAKYLQPNKKNFLACLRATATLPFVTKGNCEVDGIKLMDGGWSDPIPGKSAVAFGATKLIAIRTVPVGYKIDWSYAGWMASYWHGDNEKLSNQFANDHLFYNEGVDYLNDNPDHIEIHQIAPDQELHTGGYSISSESLLQDYHLGLEKGLDFLRKIREE